MVYSPSLLFLCVQLLSMQCPQPLSTPCDDYPGSWRSSAWQNSLFPSFSSYPVPVLFLLTFLFLLGYSNLWTTTLHFVFCNWIKFCMVIIALILLQLTHNWSTPTQSLTPSSGSQQCQKQMHKQAVKVNHIVTILCHPNKFTVKYIVAAVS